MEKTKKSRIYKRGFFVYNRCMFSWLKKHFIPHEGNNHRPHILRGSATRVILVSIIFLEIFSFIIPTLVNLNLTGGVAAVLPAVLGELTNEERKIENLPILSVNPILNKAAEMKAEDMATKGYFAHISPEGKTPWYWIEKVGYKYQYAGENLAINFTDSKDVTNAWLNSPSHKANIVKENYTEMGTAIAFGVYQGHNTVYVVQVYANPFPKITAQTEITKNEVKIKTAEIPEKINVLGAEVTKNTESKNDIYLPIELPKPTFWQKLIISPRNTTNIILFSIFGIIFSALLLYIFIKIKNHHIDIITNGLLMLSLVLAIFVANNYWGQKNFMTID
jgi:hypothetical protein